MAEAQDLHPDDQDVEALFNSIVDGNSSGQTPEDFVANTNESDTPDQDGQDDSDAQAAASEDDSTQTETDEPEAQQDTGQSTQGTDSDDSDDSQDIYAGLTAEQKRYVDDLQHDRTKLQNDVRANAGRVSALNKKLDGLLKEQQQAQQNSGQPQQVELNGKSFQEVEEEWPEVAEFVRAHVNQAVKQVSDGFQRELEPLRAQAEKRDHLDQVNETKSELDLLREHHSDYVEINRSEDFDTWLQAKPASIQSLRGSMLAVDNIELLNLYKLERGAQHTRANQQQPAAAASPKVDLSEHAELPRQGAGQVQGLPDDLDALFDLAVSQQSQKT